ncbi:MAG: Rid family detoxifying hydrolase [Coriobacteriaceae bacterium]|nr:Rid family detoxifying hydrolase [Coriobacteriaceae bacterium]
MAVVSTSNAPAAIGPYSQGIVAGDFLFVSGQIPIVPETGNLVEGGIAEQTERSLRNLIAIIEEAGADVSKIVKTSCYLAEIADFAAFNEVYGKMIDSAPARACFAVKDLPKGALVEVEAIVYLGE